MDNAGVMKDQQAMFIIIAIVSRIAMDLFIHAKPGYAVTKMDVFQFVEILRAVRKSFTSHEAYDLNTY